MKNTGFTSNRRFFVLYLLVTGMALNIIIPPFQNPDEPQHFGMILTYYYEESDPAAIEGEIIEIMDKYQWWTYLGMLRPRPLPPRLSKIKLLKFSSFKAALKNRVFYHYIMAAFLKLFPEFEALTLYYICRLCSLLLTLISIFIAYLTFNKLSQRNIPSAAYSFLLMLFLPQFIIISICVNSDSLIILLGCLFFYSSFHLILDDFNYIHFMVVVLSSLAGALSDKSSLYLIPLLSVLLILCIKNKKLVQSILAILIAALLGGPWIFWCFPIPIFNFMRIVKETLSLNPIETLGYLTDTGFNLRFILLITDSILLKFGWMSYSAHKYAYYIWRLCLILAGVGGLIYSLKQILFNKTRNGKSSKDLKRNKIVILSVSGIFIQLLAVWIFYGGKDLMAQGRHFFSLLIPFFFLFVLGLKNLFDLVHVRMSKVMLATLVLAEFFFFNLVIWLYIIPIFHLTIKSPHPGI